MALAAATAETWGITGSTFLPAYLLGGAWSLLRTGDRAAGNPFERAAGLAAGGARLAWSPAGGRGRRCRDGA